jgi:hypothetical protein
MAFKGGSSIHPVLGKYEYTVLHLIFKRWVAMREVYAPCNSQVSTRNMFKNAQI